MVAIVFADLAIVFLATWLFGYHQTEGCGQNNICGLFPKKQLTNTWIGIWTLVVVSFIPPLIAWRRREAVRFVALTQVVITLVLLLNAARVVAGEHRDLQRCRHHHSCLGLRGPV